jgi:MoaD family protein
LVGYLKVKFKSFGPVRRLLREKIIDVEVSPGATVRQVIDAVLELRGDELRRLIMQGKEISGNLIVMLNKKDVETLGGIDIAVHDGDEIAILPHVQGG